MLVFMASSRTSISAVTWAFPTSPWTRVPRSKRKSSAPSWPCRRRDRGQKNCISRNSIGPRHAKRPASTHCSHTQRTPAGETVSPRFSLDLLRLEVLQHWLLAADFLQGQFAALVVGPGGL